MSVSGNRQTATLWMQTASEDLQAAHALSEQALYSAACFFAQQCAEKAVKALWHALDQEPWGHSVVQLLSDFASRDTLGADGWMDCARALDQFYIPTRHPDSLPGITPGQAYGKSDAARAIACAEAILDGCREWLAAH